MLTVLLMPGSASAASPVLEFVTPGKSLPVSFTSEGGPVLAELAGFETVVHCTGSSGQGQITGLRSTVSEYVFMGCVAMKGATFESTCNSAGAGPEEITTGPIAAELVYLNQAKGEVGILLNPGGGVYMSFECGGILTKASGPFLSTITPVNTEASSFTATLAESGAMQTPNEYENLAGEKLKATPEGEKGSSGPVTTGVATTITVHPSVPVEIRAISAAEVEAKQREAEAKQHDEEAKAAAAAAAKRQQEEAAAKKRHDEEVEAANKRREGEKADEKKRENEATAALKRAIDGTLTAGGKAPKIAALLKQGGLTLAFSSSEPGTLLLQLWRMPKGAHLAKHGKLEPVLVAQGRAVFSAAGVGKVKAALTRRGRGLLANASKLKLTMHVRFTPVGHPAIDASRVVTLRR
jgi:hypothetical protein